ncbi:hypothetical protein VHARVF571_610015 [Vibrio harveyi]|nr:hypothetical protein VHARVF571_610015 [Vibrio harveyi]
MRKKFTFGSRKHMDEYEKELEKNNPEELKKLKKKYQR